MSKSFTISEALSELKSLVEERQEDIDAFDKKFGNGSYNKFNKIKGRLKNNNISVDIVYHTKNTSVDDMNTIIHDTENRVVKNSQGETKLNRKKLDENEHYVVWEVLDWETAMNMGDGTSWCITGRYDTNGEVKPSQAKEFFYDYKENDGVTNYVFFMPKGNEEKYCMCVLGDRFVFYNSNDEHGEYNKIPRDSNLDGLDVLGVEIAGGDFVVKNGVLVEYRGHDEDVIIPDNVSEIGYESFYGCNTVKKVDIPNSVGFINTGAFMSCVSLESVNVPNTIDTIPPRCFSWCKSLESFRIPESVHTIEESAFEVCANLRTIFIPRTVDLIDYHAFNYCKQLNTIVFGGTTDEWNEIEYYAYVKELKDTFPQKTIEVKCVDGIVELDVKKNSSKIFKKGIDK